MARLILVRHGATDWNRDGRYQGHSDTLLNDEGIAQARRLVDLLRSDGISQVVSSDLKRASVTAQILAEGLRLDPPRLDPRLREIDLGEWEGRLATEIAQDDEPAWNGRKQNPMDVGAPGGETTRQVAQRVWTCLDELAAQAPRATTAVVSHGFSLATALCRVRGLPLGQAGEIIPVNGVPIAVDWPPGG
jgi:2,3-bisphosphoglycerate-dependent phosphoglycerate mutase